MSDVASFASQLEGYAKAGDLDGLRATLDELQQRPTAGKLKVRARKPRQTRRANT